MIFSEGMNENNRCFCIFEPSPKYFRDGIDMDDVLQSNPSKFRMLRAFWKLSFVKIDDEENLALMDVILKRNEDILYDEYSESFEYDKELQQNILSNINNEYLMNSQSLLQYSSSENKIKHEMAIEASLMEYITKGYYDIFGKWDYISHQVVASPFKPVDYMDKMDLFGYRYIKGYKTISKYLVVEIKKDKAKKDVIDQIMKYVDWINEEYAYGDYAMIEACIVASGFEDDVIDYKKSVCIRNYTRGRRPTIAAIWKNVRLIKYYYEDCKLTFEEIV